MTTERHEPPRDDDVMFLLRKSARAMTLPVVILLLGGLVAAIRDRLVAYAPSAALVTTLSLVELALPSRLVTPLGLMTAGLAALAAFPALTVMLVTVAHGRRRRWREAAIAAGVLAILAMSAVLKSH